MYTYTSIYTYMYMYMYTRTNTCTCTYTCRHIHMYMYMQTGHLYVLTLCPPSFNLGKSLSTSTSFPDACIRASIVCLPGYLN